MENTELKHLLIAYKSTNINLQTAHDEILALFSVVERSEQLADEKRYCDDCGDYVGEGCDNKDCKDFKAN